MRGHGHGNGLWLRSRASSSSLGRGIGPSFVQNIPSGLSSGCWWVLETSGPVSPRFARSRFARVRMFATKPGSPHTFHATVGSAPLSTCDG